MNTNYSKEIQNARDEYDNRNILKSGTLTPSEIKVAYGHHATPFVFFLVMSNAVIYASRNNLGDSRKFTLVALLGSMAATKIISHYVFGYEKLRKIHKAEMHSTQSAMLYESYADKKI